MDKRLVKRHKRQVSRARDRVRLSEPDVRTEEQIKAARETSQPKNRANAALTFRPGQSPGAGLAATTDVQE